jgi:plastocyanin
MWRKRSPKYSRCPKSLPSRRSSSLALFFSSGRDTFDRAELRAKVGEIVALRLENSDTLGHSFDIDAFNVHVPMPSNAPALALFTPTKPGTYTFYCRIPGHTEAGMAGTLIVER